MLVPDWIFIGYASHLSFPHNSNSYPQMKHKFIMMEIEAGLWGVVQSGSIHTSSFEEGLCYTGLLAKEATRSQPTLPRAPYWIHTLHVFYNVPDRNGQAGE